MTEMNTVARGLCRPAGGRSLATRPAMRDNAGLLQE